MITNLNPTGPGDSSQDSSNSKSIFVQGTASGPMVLYAKAAGGNWSSANTWSLIGSSGTDNSGPPDATQPYDVIFEAGSGNVTIDANASCRSLDCTSGTGNYTGTLTHGSFNLTIGHTTAPPSNISLKFSSGMTYTPSGTATIVLSSTVVTQITVATAGKSLLSLTASGLTGSWLQVGSLTTTSFMTLSGGTYDTGNNTVTTAGLTIGASATVNLNSSVVNLTRTTAGNVISVAGTLNAGLSEIVIANASASARTFAGGGKTFYDLTYIVNGSTGGLVITGANTFHNIRFSDSTNARTLTLPSATTTTITGSFLVSGTVGKLMSVISSTAGSQAILSKSSGMVSCDYLSLKDSGATGGASFYAGDHSTDVSNNTGWFFTSPPAGGGGAGTSYLLLVKAGS